MSLEEVREYLFETNAIEEAEFLLLRNILAKSKAKDIDPVNAESVLGAPFAAASNVDTSSVLSPIKSNSSGVHISDILSSMEINNAPLQRKLSRNVFEQDSNPSKLDTIGKVSNKAELQVFESLAQQELLELEKRKEIIKIKVEEKQRELDKMKILERIEETARRNAEIIEVEKKSMSATNEAKMGHIKALSDLAAAKAARLSQLRVEAQTAERELSLIAAGKWSMQSSSVLLPSRLPTVAPDGQESTYGVVATNASSTRSPRRPSFDDNRNESPRTKNSLLFGEVVATEDNGEVSASLALGTSAGLSSQRRKSSVRRQPTAAKQEEEDAVARAASNALREISGRMGGKSSSTDTSVSNSLSFSAPPEQLPPPRYLTPLEHQLVSGGSIAPGSKRTAVVNPSSLNSVDETPSSKSNLQERENTIASVASGGGGAAPPMSTSSQPRVQGAEQLLDQILLHSTESAADVIARLKEENAALRLQQQQIQLQLQQEQRQQRQKPTGVGGVGGGGGGITDDDNGDTADNVRIRVPQRNGGKEQIEQSQQPSWLHLQSQRQQQQPQQQPYWQQPQQQPYWQQPQQQPYWQQPQQQPYWQQPQTQLPFMQPQQQPIWQQQALPSQNAQMMQLQLMAEEVERESAVLLNQLNSGSSGAGGQQHVADNSAAAAAAAAAISLPHYPYALERDGAAAVLGGKSSLSREEKRRMEELRVIEHELQKSKKIDELEEYKERSRAAAAARQKEMEYETWFEAQRRELQQVKMNQVLMKEKQLLDMQMGGAEQQLQRMQTPMMNGLSSSASKESLSTVASMTSKFTGSAIDRRLAQWRVESAVASPLDGGRGSVCTLLLREHAQAEQCVAVYADGLIVPASVTAAASTGNNAAAAQSRRGAFFRLALGLYDGRGDMIGRLQATSWQRWDKLSDGDSNGGTLYVQCAQVPVRRILADQALLLAAATSISSVGQETATKMDTQRIVALCEVQIKEEGENAPQQSRKFHFVSIVLCVSIRQSMRCL
jgi:hypothetical protein